MSGWQRFSVVGLRRVLDQGAPSAANFGDLSLEFSSELRLSTEIARAGRSE